MNYPLTLEQYIAQMPMQEAELARMGAQIAEALSVIHQQGFPRADITAFTTATTARNAKETKNA